MLTPRTRRCLLVVAPALLLCLGADDPRPGEQPITTAKGELGDLLRTWWKEGTAAGNAGDWYDNRDGGHSELNLAPYPQLAKVAYSEEDIKRRRHWAAQTATLPHVTFGNSSTSAPPRQGGSNPRHYYVAPAGLALLYQHYTRNNVYIYPEHRDHDPGRNGKNDGFGDLYPTNTPYLIISQGSSGSDQPFMRAVPFTLAAFRPEVKKKLVETGLLMPTLQMILRSTGKHLNDPKEYLTGKAHPTVFEGTWVNDLKMAQLAHAITLKDIPPMVQLKVVEEDQAVPGRDFFEPAGVSDKLGDTPAVIARVFRGKDQRRRIVVSAEGSRDLNQRPLTYEWVVLRGDAEKITIKPLNSARSAAEITVLYQARRPVAPGSPLESNRVDIGVFVHNGVHYSAPGFVTYFTLDSEARTYDSEGRVQEIGHGMGETSVTVADWPAFFRAAGSEAGPGRLLKLSKEERASLRKGAEDYQPLHDALTRAQDQRKAADTARQAAVKAWEAAEAGRTTAQKAHQDGPSAETEAELGKAVVKATAALEARRKADAEGQTAQKAVAAALKAANDFLGAGQTGLSLSLRELTDRAVQERLQDVNFFNDSAEALSQLLQADGKAKANIDAARRRLVALGIAKDGDGNRLDLQPLRPGPGPVAERLTAYERTMLQRFNASVLADLLFPGVLTSSYQVNYVDHRLTAPKGWRDVYRHDATGNCLGWTRYDGERVTEFNADGLMILEKDEQGRCQKGRTVRYVQDPPDKPGNWKPLRQVPGSEIVTYEYDGEQDTKGRVKKRENVDN